MAYLAWIVIGAAMAATLYEPAMAVLVALDPARRYRTLAVVTVAGGLASTVFAPLGGWLVEELGWRHALAVLGVGGGLFTTLLHAVVLPPARAHSMATQVAHLPAPPVDKPLRELRSAVLFEQAAIIASTAYLIALLVDRGTDLSIAAALGVMGLGKVAGCCCSARSDDAHSRRWPPSQPLSNSSASRCRSLPPAASSRSQPYSSSAWHPARPPCCAR